MVRKMDLAGVGPVYQQIVDYFWVQISTGERAPGRRLPPERSLAAQLGVNRSTVSAASDELRAQGLIRSVPGRGTHRGRPVFVCRVCRTRR